MCIDRHSRIALALVASALAVYPLSASSATLTKDNAEVVVAANAAPVVKFASEEMTNLLARVLGAPIPLVNSPTASRASIILGDSEWSRAAGVDVVMTRTDDRLLYDRNVDYHGRKKKLDLAARLEVAKTYEESIFISIHMNSFSDPKYSGLQVWYSPNDPSSTVLAQMIQSNVKSKLQPNNNRKIKAADSKIFLLDNAISPSVLIECGFLSNAEEAAKFENTEYKRQLAFTIFVSIMSFLDKEAFSS